MNRKERRSVEKKLGLTKHYGSLPRNEKFKRIRENIENGSNKHNEFVQSVAVKLNEQRDELESNAVASRAEQIAKSENIPYIDALSKAKNQA